MTHADAYFEAEQYLSEQISQHLCTSRLRVSILSIGAIDAEWYSDDENNDTLFSQRTFSWRLWWRGEDNKIVYGKTHKSKWVGSSHGEEYVYVQLTDKEKNSLLDELEIIGHPGLE